MFSNEFNGYNKKEVENFISSFKAEYEKKLMEERLKVLEAERKMLEMKNKSIDIDRKQNKIMDALASYKKMQAEGSRNIEVLLGQQLKVIYVHLQNLLDSLEDKYPEIIYDKNFKTITKDMESILEKTQSRKNNELIGAGTENDSMRILLSKMQEKKVDKPREVQIERVSFDKTERGPSQIRPVCDMQLDEDDDYTNLVDKFLNTAPEEEIKEHIQIQSSGFDLKEAINPKQDLSEIMKAFDFYSDSQSDEN